ncbi:hypothetical protein BDV95DRAFT_646830 [Massariosphaeria phaeospora]|uniref:Protein kinase domain-containing protein n=1 Tax=Massariosphaeria phaeospora TaxID=100035 RepID=A0A7C8M786_9PLEO|nr:hypothetical protein BDV95DRAFT_646830 [Massariosphaeria phaeospora]
MATTRKRKPDGQAPFKTAWGYYQAVYRARLKARFNHWSRDRSTIPTAPKARTDPGPFVAPQMPVSAPAPASASVVPATRPVNSTSFPFWPEEMDWTSKFPTFSPDETGHKTGHKLWVEGCHEMPDVDARRWHGVHFLGEGGFGKVGLWIETNENNIIVDRMAVKEVKTKHTTFTSPLHWRDRLILDIAMQERISLQGGHPNIIKYRGHRMNMSQWTYRLYSQFCEYGDLNQLLSTYLKPWHKRYDDHVDRLERIQAGEEVDEGSLFLIQSPSNSSDFDLAFFELQREGDVFKDNPGQYCREAGPNEDNILLPEWFHNYHEISDRSGQTINASSDVYMIGALMWRLIIHSWSRSGPRIDCSSDSHPLCADKLTSEAMGDLIYTKEGVKYSSDDLHTRIFSGKPPFEAPTSYSPKLLDLVRSCLEFDQTKRATLEGLKEEIAAATENPPRHIDSDLKVARPVKVAAFRVGSKFRPPRNRRNR